uniref:Protein EARLY FLOWERING 4 domain-containing protein n=1 Tax=Oryza nivara TaxID=4536 RepID=A0A0E0GJD7_ORYNI
MEIQKEIEEEKRFRVSEDLLISSLPLSLSPSPSILLFLLFPCGISSSSFHFSSLSWSHDLIRSADATASLRIAERQKKNKQRARTSISRSKEAMDGDTLSAAAAEDGKVLHAFQTSFVQVQSLLDQNRVLINEINQNHESKVPGDLSRNVGLIRELNNNIRRVVDLYADLSSLFAASSPGPAASEGASVGTAVRHAGHKRVRSTHLD